MYDGDGRPVAEFRDQLESRIRIVQVVVAEFLALHLAGGGDARPLLAVDSIKGGALVRVLAIAQHLFRSEEHTSELQSLMRISYAVFCLKNKKPTVHRDITH